MHDQYFYQPTGNSLRNDDVLYLYAVCCFFSRLFLFGCHGHVSLCNWLLSLSSRLDVLKYFVWFDRSGFSLLLSPNPMTAYQQL